MSGPKYAGFVVEGFSPAQHAAVIDGFRAALAEPRCAEWLSEFGGGRPAEGRTVLFIPHSGACWLRYVWDECSGSEFLLVVSFGDVIAKEIAKRTDTAVWLYAYTNAYSLGVDATCFSPQGAVLEKLSAGDETKIPAEVTQDENFNVGDWLAAQVHGPMCARIGWNEFVMQRQRTGWAPAPPWLHEKCETLKQPLNEALIPKLFATLNTASPVAEPEHLADLQLYFPSMAGNELRQLATEWGWTVSEVLQLVWERAKAKLHAELASQANPDFPFPMPPAGTVKSTFMRSSQEAPPFDSSGDKEPIRVSFEQIGELYAFAIAGDSSLSKVLQRAYVLARPSLWTVKA